MLKFRNPGQASTTEIVDTRQPLDYHQIVEDMDKPETNASRLAYLLSAQFTKRGMKQRAFSYVYKAFEILKDKGVERPALALVSILEKIKPTVGFRVVKKKNKILRLPYLMNTEDEWRKACNYLAHAADRRREPTLPARLAALLLELMGENAQSDLLKKKQEDQRLAVQNMMYFRYIRKWKFSKRRVT